MSDVIIYEDGSVALNARVEKESVWLNQKQMANLFEVDSLKNIYKNEELGKSSTTEKISVVQKEGSRDIKRNISFYNKVCSLS